MAQRNQPDNGLGGFANSKFVLINGDFWNCREKRRYIQGQAWLNEFTFIVLQCYLQILGYIPEYEYETNQWDCDAQSYVKERKPLNECGSLEILKYMFQFGHVIINKQSRDFKIFLRQTRRVKTLRNTMTHEVGKWTNTSDTLQELLNKMKSTSE